MHIQSSALCKDIFIAHSICEGLKKKYKNTKYCSLQSHCFIQINKIIRRKSETKYHWWTFPCRRKFSRRRVVIPMACCRKHHKEKENLCETGLEIAGCRHAIAQHAVNMMHVEVYGYAHYYFLPKNVQFFWYDAVRKYWAWIWKHNKEVTEKVKPALSVMHAKAHAWYCQVSLNGVHKTH